MNDFVFLFRSTAEEQQAAMGTPEAAPRSLQDYVAWMNGLQANGHLKDPGQPLDRTGRVVRGATIMDGPYVEAKDLVLGFIVVRARDLEQAAELAAACPIATGGGCVEVRPVLSLPY